MPTVDQRQSFEAILALLLEATGIAIPEHPKHKSSSSWGYWISGLTEQPDWRLAAQTALEFFFPYLVVSALVLEIERLRPLAYNQGFDIQVSRCKM